MYIFAKLSSLVTKGNLIYVVFIFFYNCSFIYVPFNATTLLVSFQRDLTIILTIFRDYKCIPTVSKQNCCHREARPLFKAAGCGGRA